MTASRSALLGASGQGAHVDWNTYIASLSPWAWWKLDDATTATVIADSSGNSRPGSYPNGSNASFPVRHVSPLITGSTYSLTLGGGGNNEVWANDPFPGNLFGSGSWTYGCAINSTATNTLQYFWSCNTFKHSVNFNFNFNTFAGQAGTVSLSFDASGTNSNALVYTSSGWNDGSDHLWFFEYDSVADTISIWKDGTKVATKARAGTKPTTGNTYTAGVQHEFSKSSVTPNASMTYDELLFFNRVLTPTEHSNLATYR